MIGKEVRDGHFVLSVRVFCNSGNQVMCFLSSNNGELHGNSHTVQRELILFPGSQNARGRLPAIDYLKIRDVDDARGTVGGTHLHIYSGSSNAVVVCEEQSRGILD